MIDLPSDHGSGRSVVIGKIVIEEFERRFGDTAELVGGVEYDPTHFNTRRITTLMVAAGSS